LSFGVRNPGFADCVFDAITSALELGFLVASQRGAGLVFEVGSLVNLKFPRVNIVAEGVGVRTRGP